MLYSLYFITLICNLFVLFYIYFLVSFFISNSFWLCWYYYFISVNIDLVSKMKYNRFIPLFFNSYNIRTTGQRCRVCTLSSSYYNISSSVRAKNKSYIKLRELDRVLNTKYILYILG